MTTIPQAMESPVPLREFVVSPGFAGAAAVVAALIVLGAVLLAARRSGKRLDRELALREHHHQQLREAEQRAAASQRAWDTLRWLVETAGIEPAASEGATLGLGPELAMATLRGLLRDAEQLGDETLADAVTVYQSQFALVLAQQGGPLSELAAAQPSATTERNALPQPAPDAAKPTPSQVAAKPATSTTSEAPTDENTDNTTELAAGGRRHKR
jgi:hypothetical protein